MPASMAPAPSSGCWWLVESSPATWLVYGTHATSAAAAPPAHSARVAQYPGSRGAAQHTAPLVSPGGGAPRRGRNWAAAPPAARPFLLIQPRLGNSGLIRFKMFQLMQWAPMVHVLCC